MDAGVGTAELRLLWIGSLDPAAPADGFRTQAVPDLAEGKRRALVETFDAVLLACPEAARGDAPLKSLGSRFGGAPLLLLVDPGDEPFAHQAVQHGAVQDYLVRGHASPALLAQALRYAVSRRGMLDALRERRRREDPDLALDRITSLPNRALFFDRLGDVLQSARRDSGMSALVLLGLEGFRLVRDTLGPGVGDPLLVEIAGRLRSALAPLLGPRDFIARISGDDFAVVLADPPEMRAAALAAEAALAAFQQPFLLQGLEFFISLSAGASLYPFDGADAEALLHGADLALRRARESGDGGVRHVLPAVDERYLSRLELSNSLRLGVARDEFVVHYMPQVDLRLGRVSSFEALVRWQHPTLGLVPPGDFIPLAEESGLILPLGERVLRAACAQTRAWRDAGLPPARISVNISARQFQHQNPARLVERILRDTGLDPSALELEITESAVMQDPDAALATLRALKDAGVGISIDDFGTGYSSLSYLRSFPIDGLKVDRSFVKDVCARPEDQAIVGAVIALGRSLGLKVVAEGIEGPAAMAWLRERGADEGQGYHFSRPVPAGRAAALLKQTWT